MSVLCQGEERKEIMHFHYITYMATPQHKNTCPGGHEIYNFGRHFLGHHNYKLTLSILCLGEERKILKEIMHFHDITYMAKPQHKKPWPGGHEIYDFRRPFLCHHNYILTLSVLCLGVEKKIFKEIMHFHFMTYSHTPAKELLPQGYWNLQFWYTTTKDNGQIVIRDFNLSLRLRWAKKALSESVAV